MPEYPRLGAIYSQSRALGGAWVINHNDAKSSSLYKGYTSVQTSELETNLQDNPERFTPCIFSNTCISVNPTLNPRPYTVEGNWKDKGARLSLILGRDMNEVPQSTANSYASGVLYNF